MANIEQDLLIFSEQEDSTTQAFTKRPDIHSKQTPRQKIDRVNGGKRLIGPETHSQVNDAIFCSRYSEHHANMPVSQRKHSLDDLHDFAPRSKGEATWNENVLFTYDGGVLVGGIVEPRNYAHIKGIDLVTWFTENYVRDQKRLDVGRQGLSLLENSSKNVNKTTAEPAYQNRTGRKKTKNTGKSLLDLPAEVRNMIYAYTIPQARILVGRNRPGKDVNFQKTRWNPENSPIIRPPARLGHIVDDVDVNRGLTVSSALLFSCKTIKREIECFMYAQYTFCFHLMKVLNKFLNNASPQGLRSIRKLELWIPGYGQPKLTSAEVYKDRYDATWHRVCTRVAKELPLVDSLRLQADIQEWPATMHSGDYWFATSMILAKKRPTIEKSYSESDKKTKKGMRRAANREMKQKSKKRSRRSKILAGSLLDRPEIEVKRLHSVEVKLTHSLMGGDRLKRAERRLEDRMMTEAGIKARDEAEANLAIQRHYEAEAAARAARRERLKTLPPVQARRVLTIVINKTSSEVEDGAVKKADKKYYTSKIGRFAKEDPPYIVLPIRCSGQ